MKFDLMKRKKSLIVAGLVIAAATPSFALFGVGDIVFDPTSSGPWTWLLRVSHCSPARLSTS